jgi:PAS domain S-box-containing protein
MDNEIEPNYGSRGDSRFSPQQTKETGQNNLLGLRPAHILVITIIGIFLAEVIAMILISQFEMLSYGWQTLLDALIMVAIVFPVLYWLSFRPLLTYLHQREAALADLQVLQTELEQRVEQRTADLNRANQFLVTEMAERKLAEVEIQSLAKFPEENPNPVLRVARDGTLLYANPASAILQDCWGCKVGDRLPQVWCNLVMKALDSDLGCEDETICSGRVFSFTFSPILNSRYVNVYGKDITERKSSEERSNYQAWLLDNVNDAIVASDEQYRLTAWNAAAEAMYGWSSEEVLGRNGVEILHTEFIDGAPHDIRNAIDEMGNYRGEATQLRKDGKRIPVEVASIVLRHPGGQVRGYVSVNRDISQRKLAEAALRESEERLRLANDAADLGVWSLDFTTGTITPDDRARLQLGFERYSGTMNDVFERVHPGDVDRLKQAYETYLHPDAPERDHLECRIIQADGEVRWLSVHALIYFDGEGDARHPVQAIGTSQDITGRKKVEQAILLAKQEWERTFDAVPDLVAILDNQHNILRLNRPMAERIGRTPRECIGLKCYDVVHGLTCAPDFCPHLLTCQDGKTHAADIHEPRLGGDFLVSTTPLFGPDGQMVASVHVARDITQQKQAERALRNARDKLDLRVQQRTQELAHANQALALANAELLTEIAERERVMAELRLTSAALEAAANGIFITGRHGNIRWINPAFTQMTGYSAEDVIGRNPRLLKSGLHSEAYYRQIWDTIQSGQVWRGETTNRRKDGSTYVEEQTITPILDADGKITNYISIKQDISERILAEQTLVRTNELLERYFSSIDTLIAYMDRDFNFIRVNDAYAKSSGYKAEYFLGKNHFDLYPHDENQAIFQAVVDTGEPYSVFEKPFEYPDHPEWEVTYWDWSLQPVKRLDGVVEGLVLSLVDVTGRKRAENELARQNQELLALSQVEHELREFAESLAQSTISLNSSLELEQVLMSILEQIHRAIPFTAGDILLKEGRSYRVAGILNTRQAGEAWPPSNMSYSLDDFPLLDQIFTTLQPLLFTEVDGNTAWQQAAGLEWVRSYVGAPLVASGQVFGIINLHSDLPRAFDHRKVEQLMAYTAPAAAAMQNAWLFEQVRSSREHLQALSRRLVEVQEGERRYIASELHDQVGQALTGLTLGLQLIERKATDPQAVQAEVFVMNRMLESVLEELHRLAMDLRPASLDHLGLATALRQHVAMVNEKYGLEAKFEMLGPQDRLPDDIEIAFYRIVQEALNNVVRHARAKHVDVAIDRRADCLVLIIEDDGKGFDPQAAIERGDRLGLFGMRERAEMLGGNLIIESTPGKGTTLVVEVPYGDTHPDRG